jgi:hypothetical protein
MVTNRTVVCVIFIATVMAYFPSFLSWYNSYSVLGPSFFGSKIRAVQFEKGYLNVTIINADRDYIISEITIYLEYGKGAVILLHELVHEPISLGTQSICVDFNWPSGYAYKLLLKKSDGATLFRSQIAP